MMPICGWRGWFGRRCNQVAEQNIGKIVLPGHQDGFGKPWEQTEYLCGKHQRRLLWHMGHAE